MGDGSIRPYQPSIGESAGKAVKAVVDAHVTVGKAVVDTQVAIAKVVLAPQITVAKAAAEQMGNPVDLAAKVLRKAPPTTLLCLPLVMNPLTAPFVFPIVGTGILIEAARSHPAAGKAAAGAAKSMASGAAKAAVNAAGAAKAAGAGAGKAAEAVKTAHKEAAVTVAKAVAAPFGPAVPGAVKLGLAICFPVAFVAGTLASKVVAAKSK